MMSIVPVQEVPRKAVIGLRYWDMFPAGRFAPSGSADDGTQSARLRHQSGRPLRILIVEDDPAVAEVLQDMVAGAGGQSVGVITSALAAVGAAAVISPDVVLMDVRLPGAMDGLEATHVIHARRSAAVIIITGAGSDPDLRERLKDLEGVETIFKPVLENELCTAILRACKPDALR